MAYDGRLFCLTCKPERNMPPGPNVNPSHIKFYQGIVPFELDPLAVPAIANIENRNFLPT
jgi:hypothetical protein